MFIAALLPGLLALSGYMVAIMIYVRALARQRPGCATHELERAPAHPARGLARCAAIFRHRDRWHLRWHLHPTEAAAIGTIATGALALLMRELTWQGIVDAALDTASATAMIFLISAGRGSAQRFLAISQMPVAAAQWVLGADLPPMLVLLGIVLIYLVLGCVMDSLSMLLLTIPIFLPIVLGLRLLGLGQTDKAIWFGILALMVEIGLITPPVGMNLFIINSLAKDVPMKKPTKARCPSSPLTLCARRHLDAGARGCRCGWCTCAQLTHEEAPAHMLTLYTYFRSSAAYRVRIALGSRGCPTTATCRPSGQGRRPTAHQRLPGHQPAGPGAQLQRPRHQQMAAPPSPNRWPSWNTWKRPTPGPRSAARRLGWAAPGCVPWPRWWPAKSTR